MLKKRKNEFEVEFMKRFLRMEFVIVLAALFCASLVLAQNWVIDDDSVILNVSKGFINITPHTITESGWVHSQIMSRIPNAYIDACYGVDSAQIKFNHLEFYNPHNETWIINGTNYSVVVDWTQLSIDDVVDYEYVGMNRWYCKKDIFLEQNKLYHIRFLAMLKFIPRNHFEGKYSVALKLSSDSIHEAIINNRFILLDPWYNVTYYAYQEDSDSTAYSCHPSADCTKVIDGDW